ncbi:MAG: hypothetical protein ACYDBH_22010 [Acidobacteriaceae bacterium]
MPLLEIVQTRRITAMIRLDETTASQIDQYAAFLRATADEVVDKALAYVFAKDRDFQDFLRTPEAAQVPPSLRVRRFVQKGVAREAVNGAAKRPNSSVAAHDPVPTKRAAGAE